MDSLWIILSLGSALFLSVSDALIKKAVSEQNEYAVAWLRLLFTIPPLAATLFFIEIPLLDREFFLSFVVALPLEITAIVLYIKALKASALSLTLPFLSFTPLFLILFSYLILHEPLTLQGVIGIVSISVGSYILHVDFSKKGFLEPFRAIIREKGSLFMIIVAFLYSFTSSLGKIAVVHSSALFFGATYFIAVTLCFAGVKRKFSDQTTFSSLHGKRRMLIMLSGFFYAFMVICHMFAISMAKAAYMIALKRTSILMGVLIGFLFFHETKAGQRFLGALIMFLGILLIILSR